MKIGIGLDRNKIWIEMKSGTTYRILFIPRNRQDLISEIVLRYFHILFYFLVHEIENRITVMRVHKILKTLIISLIQVTQTPSTVTRPATLLLRHLLLLL